MTDGYGYGYGYSYTSKSQNGPVPETASSNGRCVRWRSGEGLTKWPAGRHAARPSPARGTCGDRIRHTTDGAAGASHRALVAASPPPVSPVRLIAHPTGAAERPHVAC